MLFAIRCRRRRSLAQLGRRRCSAETRTHTVVCTRGRHHSRVDDNINAILRRPHERRNHRRVASRSLENALRFNNRSVCISGASFQRSVTDRPLALAAANNQ